MCTALAALWLSWAKLTALVYCTPSAPPFTVQQSVMRWPSLDTDRAGGCIRSLENTFSLEGGLAILTGNIALDGCVVKTAGMDDSILTFSGPAHLVESQDEAVQKGAVRDLSLLD
jgi:dihydroxyacid dehydratase/phosphogluconate dehydratase